ncbi:MAG: hypothetical protein ACTSXU_16185 [Promethearchaeota archaeon]
MKSKDHEKGFDDLKLHDGKIYTGMSVGGKHNWIYKNGRWKEMKISPDTWILTFTSEKERVRHAPRSSGAALQTEYHWYICAEQKAIKLDENRYQTVMTGLKFKIGHRRPNWRHWDYEYKNISKDEIIIDYLKRLIKLIDARRKYARDHSP